MKTTVQLESRLANRWAQRFNKQKITNAIRLVAPTLFALTFASAAHAQGTMDFSGATTLMGTFKTTTLQTVREGAEENGYIVEGFAPTSKAAGQLREAGIDATTLQSFRARGQAHSNADPAAISPHLLCIILQQALSDCNICCSATHAITGAAVIKSSKMATRLENRRNVPLV